MTRWSKLDTSWTGVSLDVLLDAVSYDDPYVLAFTSSRSLMGSLVNRRPMVAAASLVTVLIVGLNVYLLMTLLIPGA